MAKLVKVPEKTPVPENWAWIEMGKVVDIKNGFPFDSRLFSKNTNGRHPLIRIRDIVRGYTETYTDEECPAEYIIEKGDILIGMDGDFNVASWKGEDALLNQRVCCIESASPCLDRRFLLYYLPTPLTKINEATPSVTVKHLSTKTLSLTPIPIPPLAEQQRIVARIESLFAKLDEAKEKAQEALESFRTRKKSIMHNAFTGELTCRWRKLHGISDEWRALTLNDVAEYKKGPFGSSITKAMFVPKGANTYKVYEQGNAIRKTLNYGHYYITESKYVELKGFAVNPGDIIISCAGTIGEVYKLPEDCEAGVINQALMRVRLYPCITDNYFIYYFSANIRADVEDKANGTAIKNIPPFKVMKAMDIMLPSVQEQNEIVRILDGFFAKEAEAKEKADATLGAIDNIKKSILAKAFRGELGTNNPEDESAEELLKRILA